MDDEQEPNADSEGATAPSSPKSTGVEKGGRKRLRLRLWPTVVILAVLHGALLLPARLFPESPKGFAPLFLGLMGSYLLFTLWWLLASRAPVVDRLMGLAVVLGGLIGGVAVWYHPSMAGLPLIFQVGPLVITVIVFAMLATHPFGWRFGRWPTLLATLAALAAPSLVRYEGVNSNFEPTFLARWQASREETLVATLGGETTASADAPAGNEPLGAAPLAAGDWPGFRGPQRDGHVLGGSLAGDWRLSPPKELWRRTVGPGWSSFCVVGERLYTQEQRGEQECVVAYDALTGDQVWSTGVDARFSESIAGPGPRATPTYSDGDLYTLGAAGALQCLDAATGALRWRTDVLDDLQMATPPEWGLASSPLLLPLEDGRQLVCVYACDFKQGAPGVGKLAAYDSATGERGWSADTGYHSYSSPHSAVLSGVPQVLISTSRGLDAFDPATGGRLWTFDWDIGPYGRSTQPLIVDGETIVLSAGYDSGTIPIRVTLEAGDWKTEELWEAPSQELVPYFNDMVLHGGHLFGIHKKFLVSVDLATGKATWPRRVKRKTKLGNGQLVLDPGSGRLLVTTEDTGEVLIVEANPETFKELGRFEALTPERNWNHPVVAGGRLYVRHGSEAACYELPATVAQ